MIRSFYNAAAGCKLHSAAVIAYASAGEFVRFNPHLHAIVLEGGFDANGRFVHIPRLDLSRLSQYFRASMVDFFFKRQLINQRLARNMLQWDHSGFSVDGSVRIPAGSSRTREALSQTIARAPVSLSKRVVEDHTAMDFIAECAPAPARPSPAAHPPLRAVLLPLPGYLAAGRIPRLSPRRAWPRASARSRGWLRSSR